MLLRLLLLLSCLLGCAQAQELQPVPRLLAHITDQAGLLPIDRRDALEARLVALEKNKGAQVAVLSVATTSPEPLETYSMRVAEAWRLGRGGVDDGVLFIIARDDRRMRIEVGRGLEGALPDARAKRIVADTVAPLFKVGDFPGGVEAGVTAILAAIDGEALPAPGDGDRLRGGDADPEQWLVAGLVAALLLGRVLRAIFGALLGAGVVGALAGGVAWVITGAALIGLVCGVVAFVVVLMVGAGRGSGGPWIGGGGSGSWGGSGGSGWSGGGGSFGGGGASGNW